MHIRIDDFLAAGRHLRRALGGQVSPVRSGSPGRSLTEADRKWLLNAEHVPGPGLGRELVRTLSEGQDRDLRVRFQLDDLVRREPGLGVLPYLLDAVGPLAAAAQGHHLGDEQQVGCVVGAHPAADRAARDVPESQVLGYTMDRSMRMRIHD
jgi:hypothetical protein